MRPGSTLAVCEIGVLGFELPEYRILDVFGLVNRRGAREVANGNLTWWLDDRPDYTLFHRPAWPYEFEAIRLPAFREQYKLAGTVEVGVHDVAFVRLLGVLMTLMFVFLFFPKINQPDE